MIRSLLAALAALALAGCAIEATEPAAAPVTEIEAPDPPEPAPSDEDLMLEALHDAHPELAGVDDYLLVELADTICESFDLGLSVDTVLASSAGTGVTPEQAGSLVGAAVGFRCPDHLAMVQRWLDQGSL